MKQPKLCSIKVKVHNEFLEFLFVVLGKSVDLSLPWRLTGFPNNTTLTLSTRKSLGVIAVVNIALQLEDGSRIQHRFKSDVSLLEILMGFEANDPRLNLTKL